MFFWISKVLQFLFSPLTWIIIVFALSFFLKNVKRKKRAGIIAFSMLLFFTNNFFSTEALRLWEVHQSNMDTSIVYDVAIVLGGGMISYEAQNQQKSFRHNTDRIFQAIHLYQTEKTEKILITGGSGSLLYRNMQEACLLKEYLVDIQINPEDIWTDCTSDNTYENAQNSAIILKDSLPQGSYLLITSAFHMRRAQACFTKAGLNFHILPTNHITGARRWDVSFLLIPSTQALRNWEIFFRETFGYIIYIIAGYI
jgi:uncharacterized SAM-binding protein YcdF (DUF218 family)